MTKTTTKMAQLLSKLAIVPILLAAFLLFSKSTEAQTEPSLKDKVAINKTIEETKTTKPDNKDITFGRTEYPHTVEGVSDDELKNYAGTSQKYLENILKSKKKNIYAWVSDSVKNILEPIFKKMSLQQQKEQFIYFFHPIGASPNKKITKSLFDNWKNPKFCGLWIDEKRVKNNVLNNYNPEDFDQYFQSSLTKRALNYGKFKYEVSLMTIAFHKKYNEEAYEHRFDSYVGFNFNNKPKFLKNL